MLYCLTSDLYNDMEIMFEHSSNKYDSSNCKFLDFVPSDVRMCRTFTLITEAVRHLRETHQWQGSFLMVRNWISSVYPHEDDTTNLYFKHRDTDEGFWEYRFVALGYQTFRYSSTSFSSNISVIGGVPHYTVDDGLQVGEYTITEIAKSNQYFKMASVFPANPNMFAGTDVEYIIPYSLL